MEDSDTKWLKHRRPFKSEAPPEYGWRASMESSSTFLSESDTAVLDSTPLLNFCASCRNIDFEEIFQMKVKENKGSYLKVLKAPEALKASKCPLCQLFAALSPSALGQTGIARLSPCHLRAFSANRALYGSYDDQIPDLCLIGVVRIGTEAINSDGDKTRDLMKCSLEETGYICSIESSLQTPYKVRLICPEAFDAEFARYCTNHCQEYHGLACTLNKTVAIEFLQVIECKTRRTITAPNDCQYVALSYVCGMPDSSNLTKIDGYPKVVHDSIEVTLRLGLQYLWVDRYCIDQSDEHQKRVQIRQMGLIYANAHITIIAAAGESLEYGLPGVSSTLRSYPANLRIGRHHLVPTLPHSNWSLKKSKWNTRGWTYQEGILSRRRLIFTDHQVSYECNGMHCAESLGRPLEPLHIGSEKQFKANKIPLNFTFHNKSLEILPLRIMSFVAEYSKRQLTYYEDRVNAMLGVFNIAGINQIMGVPILPPSTRPGTRFRQEFGPWFSEQLFLSGLFWYHVEPGERRLQFPSWSWAGWNGELCSRFLFIDTWNEWNNTYSISLGGYDCRIWIEGNHKNLLSLPDYDFLPQFISSVCSDIKFIHIEAFVFPCSILHLSLARGENLLPRRQNNRYFVRLAVGEETFIYVGFNSDRKDEGIDAEKSGLLTKTFTGILVGKLDGHSTRVMALVVEEMDGYAERVGCLWFQESKTLRGEVKQWDGQQKSKEVGSSMENKWEKLRPETFSKWLKEIPKRRTIRLG